MKEPFPMPAFMPPEDSAYCVSEASYVCLK